MRTLVIGQAGADSGHGRYCSAFVEALRGAGDDATLHAIPAMPRGPLFEVPGIKHADRLLRASRNALATIRSIRRMDPRIVHFQLLTPVIDRWWISRLSPRRVCVMTVHNVEPHRKSTATSQASLEAVYDAMDALIVHTPANKRRLEEIHPATASKISVIPHAVWQRPAPTTVDQARRALGLPSDRPIILFFGVIRQNKGLTLLLDSMNELRSMHPAPMLVIAGEPEGQDGFALYAEMIRRLNLESSVMTRIGRVPDAQMPLYFAASDVVALPYERTFQAQSGILADAYSHAVPLVVTNAGGIGETVRGDATGVVAADHTPVAFAAAIGALLTDAGLRTRASMQMRTLAQTQYSWSSIARRTLEVYRAAEAGEFKRADRRQ